MSFWDRFILWVYVALAEVIPVGRDHLAQLFEQQFHLGRLDLAHLHDLSILLLLAGSGAGSEVRAAAYREFVRRGLARQPGQVRALLNAIRTHRLLDLLEINRPHQPETAQLLVGVLTQPPGHEVWSNLVTFLARLDLVDPAQRQEPATTRLLEALRIYQGIPAGTIEFLPRLYRHVLGHVGVGNQQGQRIPECPD